VSDVLQEFYKRVLDDVYKSIETHGALIEF